MLTLAQDQTRSLWSSYRRTGAPDAREALINRYVHLARHAVDRLAVRESGCLSRDDLISHALLGLIEAVERYDPDRGVKFETYATTRIRGAVADALRAMDWVPRSVRQTQAAIRDAYAGLEARLGRPATDEEAAESLGMSLEGFQEALTEIGQGMVFSLEDGLQPQADAEGALSLSDVLAGEPDPASHTERQERKRILAEAIGRLPERERLVVGLYYYEDLTLKEIGCVLGVTEARACQIHTRALLRLNGFLLRSEPVLCAG